MLQQISFSSPLFFALFILFVPYIIWYISKWRTKYPSLYVSGSYMFTGTKKSYKRIVLHLPFLLRLLGTSALIVALARPQTSSSWNEVTTEGIDIVLALDVSSSMLAQDFSPNRLEASKNVAAEFIAGRANDRIGLVVFAGESFTQCPLTTDHAQLLNLFKDVRSGLIEDGTAIGLGLGTAVTRLKQSKTKSKVVILLTDGVNNAGEIAPQTAADLAVTEGIRVYTVGVGTMGEARYPVQTPYGIDYQMMKVEIDEAMLKSIAQNTGGQYFRATSNRKLKAIYEEIDKLEKTRIETSEFSSKHDLYFPFLAISVLALLLELTIRQTILRSVL